MEERKKYTVTMPAKIYDKVKQMHEEEGVVMNNIFVQCIEYGMRHLYPDSETIQPIPLTQEDEPYSINIPPDIVDKAKMEVYDVDEDIPAILRLWLRRGAIVNTAVNLQLNEIYNQITTPLPEPINETPVHTEQQSTSHSIRNMLDRIDKIN